MEIFKTENEYGSGEVRSWASILDENCRKQAEAISRVPIVKGHLALMPDAHFGFGPPVGSALVTEGGVMPYAVGVDIGCGMIALKLDITREDLRGKEGKILGAIREKVPSGVGKRRSINDRIGWNIFQGIYGPPPGAHLTKLGLVDVAASQFGTLGAGNHFVELSEDLEGRVWIVLHSGSRGVGNQLATAHYNIARNRFNENELENKEFSYLEADTPECEAYLKDMLWCQSYAYCQRNEMLSKVVQAVEEVMQIALMKVNQDTEMINCHHNYAEQQESGTWLTRKGAIDASEGKLGVIPGSMGAATYIVKGKGNKESYNTSPHGAGRILGRGEAKQTLNEDAFRAQMAGKTWLDRDAKTLLDEAPLSYKPIETVIKDSTNLVEPVTILSQFINYKGL